jgi:hypothetical protein
MPIRMTQTLDTTHKTLRNMSYERIIVAWLMFDGWQVFTPVVDKTDVLISDGPNWYRIQVKTVEASGEDQIIENRWKDSDVDIVICFARNSNWGYIMPAFQENKRKLNSEGHQRFNETKKEFLKAFHKFEL